ncbi:cellulose synthase/poly-beta-1,6-N-acetylglucosamine synthase-like glycosyltransferase [Halospina denitrificans]|uniref:Cellulose synthase/poly-beta-1,6-N-acetylglucosamine synthase-like glycosyltransferase n=1 Tax=Halospina denitrificans TaxID=332522 RepID=A0A4R7JRK2_9GAMM|nr:glycosyltransferase family 2 protein [Halospina denitrificans]TDT39469.1 cellulose synthase/poly-beta-1,6-N-acetylglucosamine synthase-like glycosyltransferase [Halospina denitrificans]
MLETLFWLSAVLVVYIYIGYPALMGLLALNRHPVAYDDNHQPSASILIAAYNEENDIAETLDNKIAQEYPRDKLEILVVSDESEDKTDRIVKGYARKSDITIRLFRQTPRQGKTAGLNLMAPEANGEIIIFSDANSQWAPDAVAKLVRNFADPEVGYVTGKMVYTHEDGSLMGDGCSSYMKYENWLRERETAVGSIVGVDGGIDAMRRDLYEPLSPDQLPDFVQPLKVVEKGYRAIYEPEAILKEQALKDSESEFAMRVRVSLRAIWALYDMRQLLNPLKHGLYAFQLLSHKVLRYYAFVPLVVLAFVSTVLSNDGVWYGLAFLAQIGFYGLACAGRSREEKGQELSSLFATPYYFALLNFACYKAATAFQRGEKRVTWNPRKG